MSSIQNVQSPGSNENIWKQAVIGLSDGIIISLAITSAVAYTFQQSKPAILLGVALAFLGMFVMCIGGYFAAKFRMESLSIKADEEEKRLNKEETDKTIALFKKLNLGADMQEQAASEIEKDSTEWKAFLQKNEQPFELPDKKQLPTTAFIIGASFLVGALLPLIAYLFYPKINEAIKYAVISSLLILVIVGYTKSSINGEPRLLGSIRILLLGSAATACTWLVAKIFT